MRGAGAAIVLTLLALTSVGGAAAGAASERDLHHGREADGAETLEWAVADADLIVRGRITEPEGEDLALYAVEVAEVIKGPAERAFRFRQPWRLTRSPGAVTLGWPRGYWKDGAGAARDVLLFFERAPRAAASTAPAASGALPYKLRGSDDEPSLNVIELRDPPRPAVVSIDLRVLRDAAEILRRARAEAAPVAPAARGQRPRHPFPLFIPTPRERWLPGARQDWLSPFVIVPWDDRAEAMSRALARHPDAWYREMAVTLLGVFGTEPALAELRRMAREDPEATVVGAGPYKTREFRLRRQAVEALARWEPSRGRRCVLREPDDLWRPLRPGWAWATSACALACAAAALGLSRPVWRKRVRGSTLVWLALAGVTGLAWWSSGHWAVGVRWDAGQGRHEVTAYRGGVRYLRAQRGPATTSGAAAWVAAPLGTGMDDVWDPWEAHLGRRWDRAGWVWAEEPASAPGRADRMGRAPLWAPMAAAGACVGMRGLTALRRAARRRSGRCIACGYDLRASRGRCPECGAEAPHG